MRACDDIYLIGQQLGPKSRAEEAERNSTAAASRGRRRRVSLGRLGRGKANGPGTRRTGTAPPCTGSHPRIRYALPGSSSSHAEPPAAVGKKREQALLACLARVMCC